MTKFEVLIGKASSDRSRTLKTFTNKEDAIAFANDYRDKKLKKNQVLMLASTGYDEKGHKIGGRYNVYESWTA